MRRILGWTGIALLGAGTAGCYCAPCAPPGISPPGGVWPGTAHRVVPQDRTIHPASVSTFPSETPPGPVWLGTPVSSASPVTGPVLMQSGTPEVASENHGEIVQQSHMVPGTPLPAEFTALPGTMPGTMPAGMPHHGGGDHVHDGGLCPTCQAKMLSGQTIEMSSHAHGGQATAWQQPAHGSPAHQPAVQQFVVQQTAVQQAPVQQASTQQGATQQTATQTRLQQYLAAQHNAISQAASAEGTAPQTFVISEGSAAPQQIVYQTHPVEQNMGMMQPSFPGSVQHVGPYGHATGMAQPSGGNPLKRWAGKLMPWRRDHAPAAPVAKSSTWSRMLNPGKPVSTEHLLKAAQAFEKQGRTDKAQEIYAAIASRQTVEQQQQMSFAAGRLEALAAQQQKQFGMVEQAMAAQLSGAPAGVPMTVPQTAVAQQQQQQQQQQRASSTVPSLGIQDTFRSAAPSFPVATQPASPASAASAEEDAFLMPVSYDSQDGVE